MLPPFCGRIKPFGQARLRFGHPMYELNRISGPGDRADPEFGLVDTRLDRTVEPLSLSA